MAKVVQSKGASGTTTAAVTFSADSDGRWEVGYIRVVTDTSTQVLLLAQGATTIQTYTIGSISATEYKNSDFPVFVGLDKAAITITAAGGSAVELAVTAALNDRGVS